MFIGAEEKCTDFEPFTDKFLSNIAFTDNDIGRILNGLDRNKAHDHDKMSTCRLNICIKKPLGLIFKDCLEHGSFLKIGKKPTLFLFIKKYKQSIKTIERFHFFQYKGKSFNGCCTATCFLFSLRTTWYLKINLGLNQVTPALTSSYQSPMRSINPLMMGRK